MNMTNPNQEEVVILENEGNKNLESSKRDNCNSGNLDSMNKFTDGTKIIHDESSFLDKLHKKLFYSNNKNYNPSQFKVNTLPSSKNVPSYGKNLTYHKPSHLLERRNLPNMSISTGDRLSITALSVSTDNNFVIVPPISALMEFLNSADTSVKLYEGQLIKFQDNVSCINNGTEPFYPKEAKPLLESYIKVIPELIIEQKTLANNLIDEIQKKDPSFNRSKYDIIKK